MSKKKQNRKSVSLNPADYDVAQAQADRDGVAVARLVTRAIHAYSDPDLTVEASKGARYRRFPELDPEVAAQVSKVRRGLPSYREG